MRTNDSPFSPDCEHLLQQLPIFDFYVTYVCNRCCGSRTFPASELGAKRPEDLEAELLAELGGTIGEPVKLPPSSFDAGDAPTEPRRYPYPVGGMTEEAMVQHLHSADIDFLEYLDAWIDKCLHDGTLSLYTAAQYREAIAARCAELGEVPHVREHIAALKLKPGDVLALIAPSNSTILMRQLAEETTRYLDYWNIKGVAVAVYPAGTEIRVLEDAAAEVSDKIRQFVEEKVAAGTMTREQFRQMLQREIVAQGRW